MCAIFTIMYAVVMVAVFIYISVKNYTQADVIVCDMKVNGICYVRETEAGKRTFQEAKEHCQYRNGDLLLIRNKEEEKLVDRLLDQHKDIERTWLGATEQIGDWHWVASGDSIREQGCYKDYIAVRDMSFSIDIADMLPSMCVEQCASGGWKYAGVQSGSECYCDDTYGMYGISSGNLTCSVSCTADNSVTCGGWARNAVYTVNGSSVDWSYLQPDNQNNYEMCAIIHSKENRFKMADENCTIPYSSICSFNARKCPSAANLTSDGLCIRINADMLSWHAARQFCIEQGGDLLASQHHAEKIMASASNSTLARKHWIGASRSKWFWMNGELMKFNKFNYRSPRDKENECVTWTLNNWEDTFCNETFDFFCRLDTTQTTTYFDNTNTSSGGERYTYNPTTSEDTPFTTSGTKSTTTTTTQPTTTTTAPTTPTTTTKPNSREDTITTTPSTGKQLENDDDDIGMSVTTKVLIGIGTAIGVCTVLGMVYFATVKKAQSRTDVSTQKSMRTKA